MRIERVVFDTNVLISAAISPLGKSFRCLAWALSRATLHSSVGLLDEFDSRLSGPRIARLLAEPHFSRVKDAVRNAAILVEPAPIAPVCRDPKDDIVLATALAARADILATALAARADILVTGDMDLLTLDPFEGIRILSPAAFLAAAEAGSR
jgi:putative PIN family toxin of toxin-antitoxin system